MFDKLKSITPRRVIVPVATGLAGLTAVGSAAWACTVASTPVGSITSVTILRDQLPSGYSGGDTLQVNGNVGQQGSQMLFFRAPGADCHHGLQIGEGSTTGPAVSGLFPATAVGVLPPTGNIFFPTAPSGSTYNLCLADPLFDVTPNFPIIVLAGP